MDFLAVSSPAYWHCTQTNFLSGNIFKVLTLNYQEWVWLVGTRDHLGWGEDDAGSQWSPEKGFGR